MYAKLATTGKGIITNAKFIENHSQLHSDLPLIKQAKA